MKTKQESKDKNDDLKAESNMRIQVTFFDRGENHSKHQECSSTVPCVGCDNS